MLIFVRNYIAHLNNGFWANHLLNHMHFSYTLINAMSVTYTVILILTSQLWRRVLRRYSWIKPFGIANILWFPTEIMGFYDARTKLFICADLPDTKCAERRDEPVLRQCLVHEPAGRKNDRAYQPVYHWYKRIFIFRDSDWCRHQRNNRGTPGCACGMWLYSV